jgi:glycerol-3-phosphate dehydrogenase (NAD(P)+)
MIQKIGIVGAGAWGTALNLIAQRAGREAAVWSHSGNTDLAAVTRADAILLAVPAQYVREVTGRIAARVPTVICAKGIEQGTGATMTEVCAATLPGAPLAVLSGPNFAHEIARGLPAATTLACADAKLGRELVEALGSRTFRPYLSDDPVGAELGGAVKNVIAIACGIVEGRGLGENARAALITRGLAEMTRLATAKGGKTETMMGLAGLGDLTLTCTGARSRNYALGVALGRGETLSAVLSGRRDVVEGVATAPAVMALAAKLGVEMPISAAVDAILHRGATIADAVEALLSRPFRAEANEDIA